jgi:hypothetical protein
MFDRLNTTAFVAPITQLSPVGAQAIAQLTLRRRHARPRLVVMNGELLDDLSRASLGSATCRPDGSF